MQKMNEESKARLTLSSPLAVYQEIVHKVDFFGYSIQIFLIDFLERDLDYPSSPLSRHEITVDSSGIFEYYERDSKWRSPRIPLLSGLAYGP